MGQRDDKSPHAHRAVKARLVARACYFFIYSKIAGFRATASRAWRGDGARAARGCAPDLAVIRAPFRSSIHHPRRDSRGHLLPLLLHRIRSDAMGGGVTTPGATAPDRRVGATNPVTHSNTIH